jgi:hypothetical protein
MSVLMANSQASVQDNNGAIGITLLFQSAGRPVVVQRFDPDGRRGPVPGDVSGMYPRGGAIMAFLPSDSKYPVPRYVEITWTVPTDDFNKWAEDADHAAKGRLTPSQVSANEIEFQKRWASNPHYTKCIDLTKAITTKLVEQVHADRQNTQLKLIVTFDNSNVYVEASAYTWR